MTATTDILRGELERLFELDEMKRLSAELLGLAPEQVGGTSGKGAFARALVEKCRADDALPALADAIAMTAQTMKDGVDLYGGPSEDLPPGTVLGRAGDGEGRWTVVKKLGEGGIATVHLAERSVDGRVARAAVKVLRTALARDRAAAKRWLTVARAVARIENPGLGRILDAGELPDGRPWVATEHLDAPSLAQRIARTGPMHVNEARPIVRTVLAALEALHARAIAHGGVKAENVLVVRPSAAASGARSEPRGVLVDPGADRLFARPAVAAADRSGLVPLAGTPKTLAPEQARRGHATPSADLYALAVVLYEMLTGKPPFSGPSPIDVIAKHLLEMPPPPSTVAPRGWVGRDLDELVLRALAKDPAQRWASAAELREALEAIGRASVAPSAPRKGALDAAKLDERKAKLLEDPGNEELAAQIEELCGVAGEVRLAVELFAEAAAKAGDADAKKSLLFRIARLRENELGDPKGAEAAYRGILEIDGQDEIARVALEELKRQSGDHEGLVELLLEKTERDSSPGERAPILREIAEIYEQHLGDADNAFVAWVQALVDDPHDERTQREIERLAGQNAERWSEALTALNEAVQTSDDRDGKIALYVLMGRWYADRLARPDFALSCYAQALALDPASEAALDGTAELYRKAQSWPELAALLLRRAELASPVRARDALAEAADIVHRKLGDTTRATELYEKVLAADPAHPRATEALELLYSERKDWGALVRLLQKKAENQRGADRVETLVALAEVWEDRLADADEAIAAYRAALAIDARHLGALKGAERILSQKGRFGELLENLRAQLELVATPRQKITLLERIGGMYEEEFVDHAKAVETYEQIVAIEPGHDAANAALARLYRHLHRFDDLAATLERHARGSDDDARKIGLLLQAAKVLAVDVGAPDRAIAVAERVLAIDPHHAEALDFVARVKAQVGDTRAALEAVERMADAERDPVKKADLLVRAGRMLEDSGDKDGAIARYKAALDAHKDNAAAASALRAIYAARGDAHGAAELLLREIAIAQGPITQAKLYAELGAVRRDRLEDPVAAKEAFAKAIELDPTCTPAALGLGQIAFEAGQWAEAAKYYEPLLARTGEMSGAQAREISLRCGDAFRKLGQFDKAQRAYLNAKAFAPDDRDVLERVAAVTFEAGAPDEAAELYRDILAKFGRDLVGADRGQVLYRFGEALRRAGQYEEAEKALEEAARHWPGRAEPLLGLEALYEAKQDWEKVVATLRRLMDSASDEDRFRYLVECGDVLLTKLGDKQRASKSYVAALELRGDDRNLLTKLMGVYSETKDWGKLVEVILRIADLVQDPAQLAKYYNTAAAISHVELKRLDEAADYYEQALQYSPSLVKAFEGLVDVLTEKADWARLETAYRNRIKKLEGTAKPEELAHLWDALGELLEHRLHRPGDAVEAFDEAQKLDPGNRRRLEQLAEIYAVEPKRWFARAVAVHQQLLALSPYRIESYQALRRLYTEAKKPDESWCVCQALSVLKNAEPDEEAFYKKHRARKPAPAKDTMSEEIWSRLVVHPEQDPLLTDIFTQIAPAVIATRGQPIGAFKLGARRDAQNDEADVVRTLHYAAGITRIPLPEVYYRDDDPGGLSFVFSAPPAIGVGRGARAGGPAQALAFVAGRHLAYLRGGMFMRQLVPTGSGLRAWLLAAIKSAVPQFPVPGDLAAAVTEHLGALRQHLTGPPQETLRSLVQKLLSAAPELDLKKWTAAVDLTADRVGFILANDLEIATAVVRASPEESSAVPQKDRLRELHLYGVSEQYLQLRHRLGIAIGDER